MAAAMALWGSWWWVRHTYVSPTASRPAAAMAAPAMASPDICVEPDGTIVNNCAEELAEGEFVLAAPGQTATVAAPQQEEAEQPAAADPADPGPCVTPPGAIFSPDCAAPPNSSAVGGGPSGGGGGGEADAGAEPNPCITPPGAIYSPDCAATPAPK